MRENIEAKRFLILVCTYNERENIALFLPALMEHYGKDADILVIDDNSPDGTSDWVDYYRQKYPSVFLLKRSGKLGRGSASKEGYEWFLQSRYQFLIEIDCDFSHDYLDIRKMMERCDSASMVVGSRLIPGGSYGNYPFRRILLSKVINKLFCLFLNLSIKDCVQSFHLIDRKIFEKIPPIQFKANGFSLYVELKYLAKCAGFSILELPIKIKDRSLGCSKLGIREQFLSVLSTMKSIIKLKKSKCKYDSMVEYGVWRK